MNNDSSSIPINKVSTTSKTFFGGPATPLKVESGIAYIKTLLDEGIPCSSILVFTPQREYQQPYKVALQQHPNVLGGLQTATLAGLSRRSIELFWPLIAEKVGFSHPHQPPQFLTLETAQYHMLSVLKPYLDLGRFANLVIDRNRLSSQILDNLNKSSLVGLELHAIGSRLASAWSGNPDYLPVYNDAQWCIDHFREKCLANNLVDTSLQIELFAQHLWPNKTFRDQLITSYPHLLYSHCEEDAPVAHDVMMDWLPATKSALVLYDHNAGYRRFLGADPISALRLQTVCQSMIELPRNEPSGNLADLAQGFTQILIERKPPLLAIDQRKSLRENAQIISTKYQPELLAKVAEKIASHLNDGTAAKDIVVLAPYINDTLWFPLRALLQEQGIEIELNRPSRSMASEPIVNAVLTLARLCHPNWNLPPSSSEFTQCIFQILAGIDLVRAKYLSEIVYRTHNRLTSYSQINPDMRNRIGDIYGRPFDELREWIEQYRTSATLPLDHFIRRLFGEILTQSGFALREPSLETAAIERLVQSANKFRQSLPNQTLQEILGAGKDYIDMVRNGVISATYTRANEPNSEGKVSIYPAIAYLLAGQPSEVQFWMDAGSPGWFERIDQPLTHPYVLSRNWVLGQTWTDANEYAANMQTMHGLLQGLISLCNGKIYICTSQYNETGYEQKGPLIQATQRIL